MSNNSANVEKEVLRIALPSVEIPPPESSSDQADKQTIAGLIFEPVVELRDCHPVPALAESWTITEDGRRWTMDLAKDRHFHDGGLCTAQDVKAACERLLGAEGPFEMEGPYVPYLSQLDVQIESAHRISFESDRPMGYLPEILSGVMVGETATGSVANGTGPYRVADYIDGQELTLVQTDRTKGRYPRIQIVAIQAAEERLRALRSGAVHVASALESLGRSVDPQGISIHETVNTLSVTGFCNGFHRPFADPLARLGINLAVDVNSIIREIWSGMAIPATTVVSPNHLGYPAHLTPHPYDPEAARRLFDKVDMPSVLQIRTPHTVPDRALEVANMIAQYLSNIGIDANIDDQENRPLYAREVGAKEIGHLGIFDSSPRSTYRVMWEKISSKARGLWWQGVTDDRADELIDDAALAFESRDRDLAYAKALCWLHENPHWLYLYHPIKLWGRDPSVQGITMDAGGMFRILD